MIQLWVAIVIPDIIGLLISAMIVNCKRAIKTIIFLGVVSVIVPEVVRNVPPVVVEKP